MQHVSLTKLAARIGARAWSLRWLLVADAFLLSPLLCSEIALLRVRHGTFDALLLFAVPASLLGLCMIQALVPNQAALHAVLFPFYALTAVDLFVIAEYGIRLSSSTIAVILENQHHALDYLHDHAWRVTAFIVVTLGAWGLLVRQLRGTCTGCRPATKLSLVASLVLLYAAVGVKQTRAAEGDSEKAFRDVLAHDRAAPFGALSQMLTALDLHAESERARKLASSFRFGATRTEHVAGREIYVLVIGESSRPDRWGIYGHERDTTPRLAEEPNVVAFRDVVTQAPLTQVSVPLLITRATIENFERFQGERSLVSAFREAGFTTLWLSTQQRDQWTGAINRYVGEADIQRYYERSHDEVLVDALADLLADRAVTGDKVFAVLHTQGSHFTFADRFPPSFAVYPHDARAGSERTRLRNAYDDSILYTDFVLAKLAKLLARHARESAFFYVADHGENLLDDERELLGHFYGNEYDLRIPMLFWFSDDYARRHPAPVLAARSHSYARLSTDVVFHSVLDLAHVGFDDPRFATHSVLRPTFRERARRFLSKWEVHTYHGRLARR